MSIFENVDLLSLDAGGVIVFLDHARVASAIDRSAEEVANAERTTKIALEKDAALDVPWSLAREKKWRGWGRVMATILAHARVKEAEIPAFLERFRIEHERFNLWSRVPDGLADALAQLRKTGTQICVVSNSEGGLETLLERVGILRCVDFVLDSGKVGVEKPDPRIFEIALERAGVAADRALHLGDTYATDVVGARAANVRVVLVDPFDHYDGMHADVPRTKSATLVAQSLLQY